MNKTQPSVCTSCVMYMHTGLFCSSGKGLIIFPCWELQKINKQINKQRTLIKYLWHISVHQLSVFRQRDRFINESTKTNVTIPEARYLFSNHSVVSLGSRFLAHGFPWKGIIIINISFHALLSNCSLMTYICRHQKCSMA